MLRSIDGLTSFNYFRARVQLAHLQGRIYDMLYSVRSKKLTPLDRNQHVMQLDSMLEKWQQTIPTLLQAEHMIQSLGAVARVHMAILQHQYLLCLVFLHGLYSVDSEWVKALGAYGRAVLANMDNNTDICMRHMQPPQPSAWSRCVTASRRSIRLFLSELQTVCSLW